MFALNYAKDQVHTFRFHLKLAFNGIYIIGLLNFGK